MNYYRYNKDGSYDGKISTGGPQPDNTTTVEPPNRTATHSPQWTGSEWRLVEDLRGAWFNQTGERVMVDVLGELPPNGYNFRNDPLQNIADIKAKAGELITARLPDYKQRNYLARKAELQDILLAGGTLSDSEQAEWDFFMGEWAWCKAVIAASNEAEAAGTPVNDIVWP